MSPTVPYKMLSKGYRVSGSIKDGYKAQVKFLTTWADAFTFADQVMGRVARPAVKTPGVNFTANAPWLFPGVVPGNSAARLYASDFEIEPIGQNGQPLPAYFGLRPGEFFSHALVSVTFETPNVSWSALDDPNGLQQLDPDNPITLCEQSIRFGGQLRTRKGSGYVYSDGVALKGTLAHPEPETNLVLKFPRVPYLPRKLIQSYVGSVNDRAVLQADTGTLLCQGGETQFTATTDGLQGQMLVLEFTEGPRDWNKFERPDTGAFDSVYQKGHAGDNTKQIFPYKNLADLFLNFEAAG